MTRDPVSSEVLLRTTSAWNGAAYTTYPSGAPELTVLKITFPARTALAWHAHPMPNAAYLISGELTLEEPGGRKRRFTAGDALAEMVQKDYRGVSGEEPVVVIVFYAGVKGMPLSTPHEP